MFIDRPRMLHDLLLSLPRYGRSILFSSPISSNCSHIFIRIIIFESTNFAIFLQKNLSCKMLSMVYYPTNKFIFNRFSQDLGIRLFGEGQSMRLVKRSTKFSIALVEKQTEIEASWLSDTRWNGRFFVIFLRVMPRENVPRPIYHSANGKEPK